MSAFYRVIADDPTEGHNLASKLPDIVQTMRTKLDKYKEQMIPADFPPEYQLSDPSELGGTLSPGWC
jgi:hypothetical protein